MKEIEKIEASIYLYDCLKEVFEECAVKFMEELKNKFPETQILYFNKDEIREIYSDSNITPGIYIELDKAKKEGIDYYFTLKVEINRDELCLCFGFDSKIKKEKKEEILFRKGWVINNDKTPIDSVAIYDFGDSLLTYTNSNGYFELKVKKKILKHNIYLKKKGYETDSLRYYEGFRDRLVPVKIEDLDTVVLKKSEK